ncbi:MAG TPA: hypothetical protein ENN69_08540 [Spirochaetia bacterium]|nr:hypothetical protein [Spirochaetia bacterium]
MQLVCDEKKLTPWVDAVIAGNRVIGIQAKGDKFDYAPLEKGADLRLDFDVSLTPPKKYFLLPEEPLLRFSGEKMESVIEKEPFVLFGVHPYDVVALRQLDKLFALHNPDVHFLSRREAAVVVAVDVETPSANVFAGCLGFSHVEGDCDILVTKLDGEYLVDVKTDKGKALTDLSSGFSKAGPEHLKKRDAKWKANEKALRRHELKPKKEEIGDLLEKAYDHPIWKEKARLCFSCGSCNLSCPTCYCFDVADELEWNLVNGTRVRRWDGCMLEPFALVAGDHNFRKSRDARYRHRYYRKGKYVPDKIGEFSCVGCGRCITVCVSHIANPVEVYNAIREA